MQPHPVWVCVYVYACICWVCQINRLKRETVGLTGQHFGLCMWAHLLRMRVRLRVRSKLEGERCVSTCLLRWVSSCCVSGRDWTLPRAPTPADLSSGSVLNRWQPWLPGRQQHAHLALTFESIQDLNFEVVLLTLCWCVAACLATKPSTEVCIRSSKVCTDQSVLCYESWICAHFSTITDANLDKYLGLQHITPVNLTGFSYFGWVMITSYSTSYYTTFVCWSSATHLSKDESEACHTSSEHLQNGSSS